MKKFIVVGIFIVAILFFAVFASTRTNLDSLGAIEGNVTIGPICPVQRSGIHDSRCRPTPEMYSAAQIVITHYEGDGKVIAAQGHPQTNGHYHIDIPAGHYWIYGNTGNSNFQMNNHQDIIVQANQVTKFNVDIDTGIR